MLYLQTASDKFYSSEMKLEAIECYKQSIPIAQKLNLIHQCANYHFQIAYIMLYDLNQFEESFNYLENARIGYINTSKYQELLSKLVFMAEKYYENGYESYAEVCYTFIYDDIIKDNFLIFNNKDDKEGLLIAMASLEKFYIKTENYVDLLMKCKEIFLLYLNNSEFNEDVLLIKPMQGLILLLLLLIYKIKISHYIFPISKQGNIGPIENSSIYLITNNQSNESNEEYQNIILIIQKLVLAYNTRNKTTYNDTCDELAKIYSNGIADNLKAIYTSVLSDKEQEEEDNLFNVKIGNNS